MISKYYKNCIEKNLSEKIANKYDNLFIQTIKNFTQNKKHINV